MSSTYSPDLRIELIAEGDQAGTWGTTTNNNFQYVFESAIAGFQQVPIAPTSNNQVLTYVNGASSVPSLNQSVYAILELVPSSVSANFNVFAPPNSKAYLIYNTSGYAATFYNSTIIGNTTPAGGGITIPNNSKMSIWTDGTNFYGADDTAGGNFNVVGNLAIGGNLTVTGTTTHTGAVALNGGGTSTTPANSDNSTKIATTAFVQNIAGGLGTMSTQNANNVNISGGSINGVSGTNSGLTVGNASYATNAGNASTVTNGVYNNGGTYSINITGSSGYSSSSGTASNANAVFGKTKLGLGITSEAWQAPGKGINTQYFNGYSYPIEVAASCGVNNGPTYIAFYINGVQISQSSYDANGAYGRGTLTFIVPPYTYYQVNGSAGTIFWYELY